MHKLCPLLGPLRSKPPIVGSEEERARRQNTVNVSLRALVDLTKSQAIQFLEAKKFKLAIPGALQALKFARDVYGDGHIELVPSYVLLAEAHLGLSNLAQTEEYLSLANYSVLKNPDCSNLIRSQLHRDFGKLYLLKGEHQTALKHMANGIYYSSLELGPEHVDTAVGYYHCASIFFEMRRVEQGLAFFDKVVDIWYKYLATLQHKTDAGGLEPSQTTKACEILEKIYTTRKQYLGPEHIATGEAIYTLGLLHLFMGSTADAIQRVAEAGKIYDSQLGADHPSTKDVQQVLQQLQAAGGVAVAAAGGT